jgi:hemerythrin-like domain-containing protein
MNIYEALKKDHDELQSTLDELAAAESTQSRRTLVEKVRNLLVPHSRAEEAVFYNVLRDHDETKNLVSHAYGEHVKAEALLRGLQVTETIALHWKGGVEKLKKDISHHIAEEEGKIFSAAKRALSDEEAKTIGAAFVKLKPHMGPGLMASNLELMANLMPARLRNSFMKNTSPDSHQAPRKAS